MQVIWTSVGQYQKVEYASEADLESAIAKVQGEFFGAKRIYLPVKKIIGTKGGQRNIPDGYLIDLTGSKPRLFVVENELASHDPLRHVAVQILQFSISFESEPIGVKKVLFAALKERPEQRELCSQYAEHHGFRNLDHLLELLVFESPFAALVIIDDLVADLENVLVKKFQFAVEVMQLARYENDSGDQIYLFDPFLADLGDGAAPEPITDIDTVVVPARPEGFKDTFLDQNRWHAIRLHGSMRPQIRFIAAYQVAPVSAITYVAPVKSIEPWKDSGKFALIFSEPAKEIGPIELNKNGKVKALQNLRYTSRARLEHAKTLDDVW